MHDEIQASIMIISHQERILNIADQVVVITNGEIAQIGTKKKFCPVFLVLTPDADIFRRNE